MNEKALDEFTVDAAIAWHLKLKDASATEQDRRAFRAWLAQDERHAAAYREAERLWQEIEAPALLLAVGEAQRQAARTVPSRRRRWPLALAASVLIGVLLGFGVWRDPGRLDRWVADVATPPGQSREMVLEDGSTLFLDAGGAVDIAMTLEGREVMLRRGRLWVDVVADPQRGFVVVSGDTRIRVVGTRFAVERRGERVEVTVERGRVAVAGDARRHAEEIMLGRDQRLVVDAGVPELPDEVDADLQLAWRQGLVLFDRAGIAEVAAQLERMRPGRVLYDDAQLSALRFSGSFPSGDPEALLAVLEEALSVEVQRFPGGIVRLRLPGAGENDK